MQPTLKFNVRNQNISRVDNFLPVRNSRNYLYAEFSFLTEDWNSEETKTAIFKSDGIEPIPVVLGETETCLVPWEALEKTSFVVSVYAGNLITADSAQVKLYESGYRSGDVADPTPTVYEQVMSAFDETKTYTAEQAELAKRYAVGSFYYPESSQDNAMYYAGKAQEFSESAADSLEETQRLAEEAVAKIEQDVTDAQTVIDSLDSAVSTANTAKTNLTNATTTANTATSTANTAKTNLETATTNANTAKTNLQAVVDSAGQVNSDINSAVTAANTAAGNANAAAADASKAASDADTAADKANNATTTAETAEAARVKAEAARVSAENSRVTAEGLRVSAENARTTAEADRVTAENARVEAEKARQAASAEAVENCEAATNTLLEQVNRIAFSLNAEDGGLDIIIYEEVA